MCMQNMYSIANINRNMIIAFYETIRIPHTGTTRAERHTLEARGRRRRPNSSHSLCVRAPYEMKQKKIIKKIEIFPPHFSCRSLLANMSRLNMKRYCDIATNTRVRTMRYEAKWLSPNTFVSTTKTSLNEEGIKSDGIWCECESEGKSQAALTWSYICRKHMSNFLLSI